MAVPFLTTVIGSLPKPAWLYESTAFTDKIEEIHGHGANWLLEGEALREAQDDAVRIAVRDQEHTGIDIISDGEQRRKSYLTYVTTRLSGFDYETLGEKWVRGGRRIAPVGRCTGPVRRRGPILKKDLQFLMAEARSPVKITLPGPMTVVDSTVDLYYGDERSYALAVADALNEEALALDALGPAVIQFDEPAFSRNPEKVSTWGVEVLDRCVEGVRARTAVHICYSYPMPGVPRPIPPSYPTVLRELERSKVDQIALEFEAPALDPALLQNCPTKTVLFGCVSNGTEEVESPEHIASRLLAAAQHHPPEKLQAAPDCGLVTLSRSASRAKLAAMVKGAALARERL
ncbi:MAG: 5-methyltetrahydropteroyltriglutamate--homocysteine methyltransferase [Dehalococcoidia bacterium]